ncbi:MAG: hypothetical protein P1V36_00420 [Planctomycetota bacterium]|nr:hypothetical protein [Planctomycetota bacterium]
MTDETKRPTAQDIEGLRKRVNAAWPLLIAADPPHNPNMMRMQHDEWDRDIRTLDALERMVRAEGGRVPEVAGAVGTPVWEHRGGVDWRAHTGPTTATMYTMYANDTWWTRYPDGGVGEMVDEGRGTLAANIRAATASWNAAHPGLPPVVVPEVEAPEDVGDDGSDDGGWIAWEGGECPVPRDTLVECDGRDGGTYPAQPAHFFYWDNVGEPSDIVRYRIVPEDKPEQTPAERVAGMSDEEVEALVTEAGVGPWLPSAFVLGGMRRDWTPDWRAVDSAGGVWSAGEKRRPGEGRGDTTTPAGRMECTRRLAVHLLKDEAPNG